MPGALRWEIGRAARGMMISERSRFDPLRRLAKPGRARLRAELQLGVLRDFDSHVGESQTRNCTCDPADRLSVQQQLVSGRGMAFELQHAQPAIHLASVALPGDWLLPRIAALREADVRLVETRFRGEDAVVDLAPPAWDAGLDPPALELLLAHLSSRWTLVEDLFAAEDEPRLVLLQLELDLGGKPRPQEVCTNRLAELGLGRQEEVVGSAAEHAKRRDHPRLRREQERLARFSLAERL